MKIIRSQTVAICNHPAAAKPKTTFIETASKTCSQIAQDTYVEIVKLRDRGCDTFLTGLERGFDMMAAREVLRARCRFTDIRLIAVIPFQGQELCYSADEKTDYAELYNAVDEVIYTSDEYHNSALALRDSFMQQNSEQQICCSLCLPALGATNR